MLKLNQNEKNSIFFNLKVISRKLDHSHLVDIIKSFVMFTLRKLAKDLGLLDNTSLFFSSLDGTWHMTCLKTSYLIEWKPFFLT